MPSQPQVSFVIPHYNHAAALPRLLDSFAVQSIAPALELLVVDDRSDEPDGREVRRVVEDYAGRGLNIRLIANAARLYTKNTRLRGIREAAAPVIAFADADDALVGTEILERHLRLMRDQGADALHFNMLNITPGGATGGAAGAIHPWAAPFAQALEGPEIFRRYVAEGMRAHNLYTKLFSRELCLRAMAGASASSVRRYMEDFCLTSYFLFHAVRYRSSDEPGYARKVRDTTRLKVPGRVLAVSALLHEFVSYISERGCPPATVENCSLALQHKLRRWVRTFYADRATEEDFAAGLEELRRHADEETILRAFLIGHPLTDEIRREREARRRRAAWRSRWGARCIAWLREPLRRPRRGSDGIVSGPPTGRDGKGENAGSADADAAERRPPCAR